MAARTAPQPVRPRISARTDREQRNLRLQEPLWERRANVLAIEAGGRAGIYSFNYDRSLGATVNLGVGFSNFSTSAGPAGAGVTIVPIYSNLYFTEGNHRPYVTGGVSMVFLSAGASEGPVGIGSSGGVPVFGVGYEYRGDGGFLFRATPYLLAIMPWVGLSFGAAF